MRVIIPQSVFAAPLGDDEHQALMDIFISCADEQRHALVTVPAYDDADTRSPLAHWLAALSPPLERRTRDILERGVFANAMQPAGVARIQVVTPVIEDTDWTRARFTVTDAAQILRRSFKLLLENRWSDWAFLLRVASPTERRDLRRARKCGWLDVQGGGTGEMKRELENLVTAPSNDIAGWAEKMRLWVMFDRDAHPQDRARPSPQSDKLRDLCEDEAMRQPWPLGFHQLGRRTIENYLPIEVLRDWQAQKSGVEFSQRRTAVDALAALARQSPRARWQYNMKNGLIGDLPKKLRDEIRAQDRDIRDEELDPLFQGLDPKARRALASGFSSKIGGLYEEEPTWSKPGRDEAFQREYDRGPHADRDTVMRELFARM